MLSDRHRRAIIGVLCLVLAVAALWLNIVDPELGDRYKAFQSGSIRMLPILAVLWLALPELNRGRGSLLFLAAFLCAAVLMLGIGKTGLKFAIPAIGLLLFIGYLRRFTALLGGGNSPRPNSPRRPND